MPEYDPELLVDQVKMLGLVSREQLREAMADVEDAHPDTLLRMFLRKGSLTSWQIERLKKGDPSGLFYGESKTLFHLAEGTFARVYRGVHVPTNRPVAIKVLRQRFSAIPEAVDRFHKEAEAGMRLRHPNIVQVIDVGHQENRHYMIMEYVEGMNLRDFMKLRTRIQPMQAIPLMIGLSHALQYSLDRGVTHRDIKGTNILISNTGEAKLVDFGLATMQGDERPGVKSQRTVDYSALERTCNSPKGDPRSDIYFLGCVFYQMLTGKLPMEEAESKDLLKKMLKRSFGAIKPIAEHRYAPDEDLCHIVEKMMKVELRARYQTMSDVVSDLVNYRSALEEGIKAGQFSGQVGEYASREAAFDSIFAFPAVNTPAEADPDKTQEHAPVEVKLTPSRTILCVETQSEIQDHLRKTLSQMGFRVLLVTDAERGAERFAEAPVDAVLVDTDGLGTEAIDALQDMHDKAQEDERPFVALVLIGPRQEVLREKLPSDGRMIVLSKPVKMKQVQEAIQTLFAPA
jgi:serine/threonine protein kinase